MFLTMILVFLYQSAINVRILQSGGLFKLITTIFFLWSEEFFWCITAVSLLPLAHVPVWTMNSCSKNSWAPLLHRNQQARIKRAATGYPFITLYFSHTGPSTQERYCEYFSHVSTRNSDWEPRNCTYWNGISHWKRPLNTTFAFCEDNTISQSDNPNVIVSALCLTYNPSSTCLSLCCRQYDLSILFSFNEQKA